MKKTIGIILLIAVFVVLIGATCAVYGWKSGLAVWATAFVFTLIICFAMFLIEDGE